MVTESPSDHKCLRARQISSKVLMVYNQYITIDLRKLGYLRFWDGVTVVNANLLVFLKVYREIFDTMYILSINSYRPLFLLTLCCG